jgi:hypothetical protein
MPRWNLLVKALWLNPPFDPNSIDKVVANLVLVPIKSVQLAQEMTLCFVRLNGRVWIQW